MTMMMWCDFDEQPRATKIHHVLIFRIPSWLVFIGKLFAAKERELVPAHKMSPEEKAYLKVLIGEAQ